MFSLQHFSAQYFPPVWFAPGDESAVPPDELRGGWAPPWEFIKPPQPAKRPPPKPLFNEDEDTTLLFAIGVI